LPAAGDGAVLLAAHLNRDQLIRDSTSALSPLTEIVPPAVPDYVSSAPSVEAGTADGGVTARVELGSPWDPTAHLLGRALGRQWSEAHRGTVVRVVHLTSLLPDPAAWLRVVFQQTPSRWYRRIMAGSARLTTDPVTRMSAYSRAENWALEEGLVIPLASGNVAYLIKPRVQSLQVTPSGIMPANNSWASVSVT
jgi:hypothetical protein